MNTKILCYGKPLTEEQVAFREYCLNSTVTDGNKLFIDYNNLVEKPNGDSVIGYLEPSFRVSAGFFAWKIGFDGSYTPEKRIKDLLESVDYNGWLTEQRERSEWQKSIVARANETISFDEFNIRRSAGIDG